jgi:hypothetical protein
MFNNLIWVVSVDTSPYLLCLNQICLCIHQSIHILQIRTGIPKITLIQTLQIRTGVYKNNSYSGTTNNDWCLQKQLWFRHYKLGLVSTETTHIKLLNIGTGVYKTTLIQTLQVRTGVIKNNNVWIRVVFVDTSPHL